jgi:phosphatidylethanolamine/phosphatidyl-N-methylethanolamine N-methyltransferase
VAGFDNEAIAKAYGRWAPVYDLVFGKVFARGRAASIGIVGNVEGRILEVGVGTGLSLPDYTARQRVTGIDISEGMLRKAQERIAAQKLTHVDGLAVMDAARLAFADRSFDVVIGQYLITAVPDPEATLDEFVRVLKPGGEIILVNHLAAESGPRRLFEQAFAPIARRLGWQPDFGWDRLARWLARRSEMRLIERRPLTAMGHFMLMRFGKTG